MAGLVKLASVGLKATRKPPIFSHSKQVTRPSRRVPSRAFWTQMPRRASWGSLEGQSFVEREFGVIERPIEQRPGQMLVALPRVVPEPPEQVFQGPGPGPRGVPSCRGADQVFRHLPLSPRPGQAAERAPDLLRLPLAEGGRLPPPFGEEAGQNDKGCWRRLHGAPPFHGHRTGRPIRASSRWRMTRAARSLDSAGHAAGGSLSSRGPPL